MARKNWTDAVFNWMDSWTDYFSTMGVKKEDIIIDDIYRLDGSINYTGKANKVSKALGIDELDDDIQEATKELVRTYEENIRDKEEMITRSRAVFDTTVVQTIVDVTLDDGFNNFKEDKDFVITYEPDQEDIDRLGEEFVAEIQQEIDDFVDKSGIKDIVADFTPELLRDGEHALIIKQEEGKGITGISDDLDVINMLPYYRGNNLALVIEKTKTNTSFTEQEKLRFFKPENIIYFRLKNFKKKSLSLNGLNIPKEARKSFEEKTGLSIPKYTRVCLPIYYSAIDDIETLQAMEKLSVAQDFVSMLRSPVLGVGVPANSSSEDAKKAIKEYERHLNEIKRVVGSFKDMDIDSMIQMARERKLLPLFADGKGAIQPMNLDEGNKVAESRDAVANQRNIVALNVGYPSYYFTLNGEGAVDKATAIKLYSRYTKKLTGVQVALAEGTTDIILRHLELKHKNIKRSNISVKFRSLTNGDVLDEVDVMVATVTGLADMYDAMEKIASSENNQLVINSDKLQEVWDTYTASLVNITGVLKKDEDKFADGNFSDEDISGMEPGGSSSRSRLASRTTGPNVRTPEPTQAEPTEPELTQGEENRIDQANAEAVSDYVNSTSAELGA